MPDEYTLFIEDIENPMVIIEEDSIIYKNRLLVDVWEVTKIEEED